jgi:hypothetical protein
MAAGRWATRTLQKSPRSPADREFHKLAKRLGEIAQSAQSPGVRTLYPPSRPGDGGLRRSPCRARRPRSRNRSPPSPCGEARPPCGSSPAPRQGGQARWRGWRGRGRPRPVPPKAGQRRAGRTAGRLRSCGRPGRRAASPLRPRGHGRWSGEGQSAHKPRPRWRRTGNRPARRPRQRDRCVR